MCGFTAIGCILRKVFWRTVYCRIHIFHLDARVLLNALRLAINPYNWCHVALLEVISMLDMGS